MNKHVWKLCTLSLSVLTITAIIVSNLSTMIVEAADEPVVFTEVARSGIAWPDYEYRDNAWGGGAWGDYNDDGWLDIFLPNHPALTEAGTQLRDSALMHNNGNGTFTNVIYETGIRLQDDWHDVFWVDYDDDGDLDLWRSVGGRGGAGEGPSALDRQNADGTFTDVAVTAGVDYPRGRARGTVWQDYDGDGDLDMYFTGAESDVAPNTMFRYNGDGTFTNVGQVGTSTFVGANSQVSVADYDMDGDPDLVVTGYRPGTVLYRNDGGTFTDVTSSAGITVEGGGQSSAWGDYDNDGDLDLFISRGIATLMDHSEVWNPSGTELRFAAYSSSGDEDGLDFDSDGSVTFEFQRRIGGNVLRDATVVNLGPDGHNPSEYPFTLGPGDVTDPPPATNDVLRVWQNPQGTWHIRWTSTGDRTTFSGIIIAEDPLSGIVEVGFEEDDPVSLPNQLYRNDGDGTFTNVSSAAGVDDPQDCRGSDWGDYDNDGDLDLFVQTAGTPAANAPNLLYRNNGDGTFTDVAAEANAEGTDEGNGWGGIWGDYNNDGFLDLITHQESWSWPLDKGGYELHRNGGNSNHWLMIDLRGLGWQNDGSNRRGYGAKVWITAGGLTQYRPVHDNSHYMHHYSGPIHVGLGENTVVDELRILWPSGLEQVMYNLSVDRIITIVEGGAPPLEADLAVSKDDAADPVREGDDVSYTVNVSNNGPDLAENVVLTDELPDEVNYVSATASQGTCSEAGGVVTCDLGDIASGGSVDVTIVVNAPTAGTLNNTTSVTSDTGDPNPGNNGDSEETTVNPIAADLAVDKSDAADPVREGDDVTYVVNVSNNGLQTAENVVLTDDLPDGVIYVSATPSQGSCSQDAGTVTCNLGDILGGGSADVTIVVNAPTAGTLTNNATVTSDTEDPNAGNNSDSEETTVNPIAADLAVDKSDAVDPVTEGDDVTYVVTVSNSGPETAENVVLTDDLPDGVTYVSATPSQGTCSEAGGVVTCDLGDIASGGSEDVTIVVNAPTAGTLNNTASAASDTEDPNTGDNSDSEMTTVELFTPPTEIIIDNLDPEFSTEGSWSTYSNDALLHYGSDFAYAQPGTGADRAIFTPDIAASADYEVFVWWVMCWNNCASNAPYTVNHAGGSTTVREDQGDRDRAGQWNSIGVFTFNAGTSGSIVLTNDTDGRVVADAVRLLPQGPPPPEADLGVDKSDAADPVTEGDDVTYTVNVSNNGPDTAENVALTDNLPGDVTFVSATPEQGVCNEAGGVVTCDLDDIASGASAEVVIVVNTTTDGTITNNASATSDTFDPDTGNNSASEDTTVNPAAGPEADLALTKSDDVDPVTEGDDVTYRVDVSNNGPDTAESVVLTDNLPGGVTFVSATPEQGVCSESGGVVTCDLDDIASGASVEMVIVVNTTSYGTITNNASVSAATADPNGANNSDSEETTVNSSGPPTEIIIDNLDTGFSTEGSWSTYSNDALLHYGSDFAWARSGTGTDRAIFTPNIPTSGDYEVFVWWVRCWTCATNAPYTVNHADGSTTIPVDLSDRDRAGQWNSIGVFTFDAGTSCSIVLTDDADGRVVADAVRLVPQ